MTTRLLFFPHGLPAGIRPSANAGATGPPGCRVPLAACPPVPLRLVRGGATEGLSARVPLVYRRRISR